IQGRFYLITLISQKRIEALVETNALLFTESAPKSSALSNFERFKKMAEIIPMIRKENQRRTAEFGKMKECAQSLAVNCLYFKGKNIEATNWANAMVGELLPPFERVFGLADDVIAEAENFFHLAVDRL